MSDPPNVKQRLDCETPQRHPPTPEISLKDRFFRYFQHEITALQEQMERIAGTSPVAGERSDAADHCLAGISRLSNEVKDASSYVPTYDQRIYAEAIKALQEKLAETKATVAPRPKFTFKTKKNASAVSLDDATELVAQGRRFMSGYRSPDVSSLDSSANPTPNYASTPVNEVDQLQVTPEIGLTSPLARFDKPLASDDSENGIKTCPSSVRRPTFSKASSVSVDSHHGVHIILPGSAFHSSSPASIKSLSHCVVDMSVPTNGDKSYASFTINDVQKSLLICGRVEGPAHITDVEHSVIVVSCRQFRMHKCSNIDVYLSCSSNPIIEDCSNIRFARIPRVYALDQGQPEESDHWDQIDDFKWLKPEPSPNWRLFDQNDIVAEEVWAEMVPGGPCWSLADILRATKVLNG